MKHFAPIAVMAFATACGSPEERAAERALREGERPYREARFRAADSIYSQAAFDPRVAYNLGNALFEQALLDTALHAYARTIANSDEALTRSQAFHNSGTGWGMLAINTDSLAERSLEQLADVRIVGEDIAAKVRQFVVRDSLQKEQVRLEHLVDSALAQSAGALKDALRIIPTDEDARHNLAVIQKLIARRVKEAEEKAKKDEDKNKNKGLSERAKQLIAQADALVEQYKFTEALKVLQDGLRSEPTLRQQQDYMHKLDVVTKAAQAK
ncbi:MAG: hypothetical protein JNM62_07380 [Flavobacteriales bacterium]|nr:hypothetical protein [Flavobacteriales bacterium]